jgi:hypothetical protein
MELKPFDIIVAKEFESNQSGTPEKRKKWNKVGRAWMSKSNESLSFELFLFPNHRYVISLNGRHSEPPTNSPQDKNLGGVNE